MKENKDLCISFSISPPIGGGEYPLYNSGGYSHYENIFYSSSYKPKANTFVNYIIINLFNLLKLTGYLSFILKFFIPKTKFMNKPIRVKHGIMFTMNVMLIHLFVIPFSLLGANGNDQEGINRRERKDFVTLQNQYAGANVRLGKTEVISKFADPITITGKVLNEKGEGIPGVNVVIKGTTVGTTTDVEGKYTISVDKDDAVLTFSYLGYVTQESVVSGKSTIDISLAPDIVALNEVVVVGYGAKDRKELTSSISSVKPEELNRGALLDPAQLLQGKVPGLNITRSGDPNGGAAIILRGPSTLRTDGGASQPFYVIDGVPGAEVSLVAPNDIVSIDVLKDAAATAIYGTRAANGVIMITTKRPKAGATSITYSAYTVVSTVSKRIEMMDANQLRSFLDTNSKPLKPSDDVAGANTNWQKETQRTAYSHNHNLSLSGGTASTSYSASLNYYKEQGIFITSGLDRLNGRLSVEQKAIKDKVKIGLSLSNAISNADRIPNQNRVITYMLRYLPTVPVKDNNGAYSEDFTFSRSTYFNPVSLLRNAHEDLQTKTFLGNITTEVKLPLNLTYNLNLSMQNVQYVQGSYYNSYYTNNYSSALPTGAVNGLAYRYSFQNSQKTAETFLKFEKRLGDHNIEVLAGYSWQENINGDGFQVDNYNFPTDELGYNNLSLGGPTGNFVVDWGGTGNIYQKLRLVSDYARLNYGFKDKYLLQASLRRDGSSAFGKNNRWGVFPSFSAAWRITNEGFMADQKIFNDLKLRASYGITGNSLGFDPLISQIRYGKSGNTLSNGNYISAIQPLQNANPDLKWEKTSMSNLGIDFSILDNRVSGSIDIYSKKTTDLIWNYPVSTSQYYVPFITANAGEMSNKGIEFALNFTPVKTTDFQWNSSFNLAHNKNLLVSLSSGQFKSDSLFFVQPDGGGQTGAKIQLLQSGHPIGQFFTLKYEGKDENGVSQFEDKNGNGTIDNFVDYNYAGNAQPYLIFGWSNTLTYKKLDFNFFFRSVRGNKIFNVTRADLTRPGDASLYNIPVYVKSESVADINSYRYSSRFIEDGSYIRLDNATLGYTFLNMGVVQKLRLYLTGNNLFLITKYKGIDPEVNLGGLTPGVDVNDFYPKTRSFLLGLSVTF